MRLSDFILNSLEPILQSWEDFAGTVETPMPALGKAGLRNHAAHMLRAAAVDMRLKPRGKKSISLKATALRT